MFKKINHGNYSGNENSGAQKGANKLQAERVTYVESTSSGLEMEPHNRIVIPHSILSTKVNLQEGYSQNNSVLPDVHWSGTTQCGWMK